jgi:hypothetical protein
MSKAQIFVLWNEKYDFLATSKISKDPWFVELNICDKDYKGQNPFIAYPLEYLSYYGWHIIGKI